jgi:FKBP-type peptidyl-prolyl cis-trans isomerase
LYNEKTLMDKNFLYIMLGVAIILIAVLAMSQNKSTTQQPGDVLNGSLVSPSPVLNLNQQQSVASSTVPQATTSTYPSIATNSAVVEMEGGLRVQDTAIGTGPEVKSGDTILIHYKGTLQDGTKFDSSYDRGQPFETQIGVGKVIQGWDLGVIGMKAGGKRILTIPPDLGYGSQQAGSIPPNSTLLFEVELIAIK